jgi:hypothetical protein
MAKSSFYTTPPPGFTDTVPSSFYNSGADYDALISEAAAAATTALVLIIDGGTSPIAPGIKGDITVPFGCTITEVELFADQVGSIVVDIWKDTYANFPPIAGDSITASAKPTLVSASKYQDDTLTGWTTSITAGDILRFNVNSASTVQRVTVALKTLKTG